MQTANQPTSMYLRNTMQATYILIVIAAVYAGEDDKSFAMKLKLLQQEVCSTLWLLNLSVSGLLAA